MTSETPNIPYPLSTYKQGTAGSISGFDSVSIVNDPTLGETDSSAAAVTADIQQLVTEGIVSRLQQCVSLIESHITNYNNPHQDTFTSISLQSSSLGNTADIFNRIINGTVPLAPPVCCFTAELDVGTPFLGLTCNRNSPLTIINSQGQLETLEANQIRADYTFGNPTYPCWTDVTQLLSPPLMSNTNFSLKGVTSSSVLPSSLPVIDSTQMVYSDNGVGGVKQVIYTNTNQALSLNTDYTFSVLVYPFLSTGSLYLRVNDYIFYVDVVNPSIQYHINLSTDSDAATPLGTVALLSNGWMRISLSFVSTQSGITATIGYDQNRYSTEANVLQAIQNNQQGYQGVNGTNIFSLCYPQLTDVAGLAPIITSASSLAPTTLIYAGSPNAVALNAFIGKVKYRVYEALVSKGVFNIANFNNAFQITHNESETTYTLEGHLTPTVFNENIYSGLSTIGCISYSPNSVGWLTSNMDNKTTINDFVGNPSDSLPIISQITVGPCRGYVETCSHYAVSDDCNTLALLAQI